MQLKYKSTLVQYYNARHRLVRHIGGRPTKYHKEMPEQALKMLTDMNTIASVGYVAAMLGMSRSTLYDLGKKHPELRNAIEMGRAQQECQLASLLLQGDKNTRALMLIMVQYHGWKHNPKNTNEKTDISNLILDTPGGTPSAQFGDS